jgi:hypothetical protein
MHQVYACFCTVLCLVCALRAIGRREKDEAMTARCALPQRRPHETFEFEHWGQRFVVGVGRSSSGAHVSEVFINTGKVGTQAETLARDSAVLLSLALQYGVPITAMLRAVTRDADGKPSGPIGMLLERIADEEGVALERAVRDLG